MSAGLHPDCRVLVAGSVSIASPVDRHPNLRILLLHNRYQLEGGEDAVVAAEHALLSERGHPTELLLFDNREIAPGQGVVGRLGLAARTVWSPPGYQQVRAAIRRFRPDVLHCHNTFPLASPSVYYAARRERVPVVQTLHNYRLICPGGLLSREGRPCEDCVGKAFAAPAIEHRCYRDSRAATATVASMLGVHRAAGTWGSAVAIYLVLSEFARDRFVAGGLPASKIRVKPNFVHPSSQPLPAGKREPFVLFVGRLSPEKGIGVMLSAWRSGRIELPLWVVGDGPMAPAVLDATRDCAVRALGRKSPEEVRALMRRATALVSPSLSYEPLPLVALEAFESGLPVIASRPGGVPELAGVDAPGVMFAAGDPGDLATQAIALLGDPARRERAGLAARAAYEARYTPEANYAALLRIYEEAVGGQGGRTGLTSSAG